MPAPRRTPRPSAHEDKEQAALVEWLRVAHPEPWQYLFHVPNGGRRGKLEAARFKNLGVRAGVPDLLLLWPCGGFHGLALEMKASGQTWCSVRPEQRLWLARLAGVGYRAEVAYGYDQGRAILEDYLAKGAREALGPVLYFEMA